MADRKQGGKRKKHIIAITDSDEETTQSQPPLITPKNRSPIPDQMISITDADWGE
jgi:hypothetical protein